MQILWLDSEAEIEAIGTPSLSRAQCIEAGMKPAVVRALMGEPTATISTLASMWEWSEDGKTYTCTVYLQNNRPEGLFKNFDSVYRCEITEGPLTSLPIPDKDPTPEDAARVTEGMTQCTDAGKPRAAALPLGCVDVGHRFFYRHGFINLSSSRRMGWECKRRCKR